MIKKYKLTKKQIILLISALFYNLFVYYGSRIIAHDFKHYNIALAIDKKIPFISWMITIYFGCYISWAINYILCVKEENKRFIIAHFIGETICFLFFVFFPTTMDRPVVSDGLVSFMYKVDSPDNLFPSLHCFISFLCYLGVRDIENISIKYKYFTLFLAILVCISTLTVKQHVLADVFAGVILAIFSYYLGRFFVKRK